MEVQIKGFKDYKVNELGEVISYKNGQRLVIKQHYVGEAGYEYLAVRIRKNNKPYNLRVNRVVYFSFNPEEDTTLQVHHKNDDKSDNRLANLDLVTGSVNCFLRNRSKRKSKYGRNITKRKSGRYRVDIRFNGQRLNSTFSSLKDAILYRDEIREKLLMKPRY